VTTPSVFDVSAHFDLGDGVAVRLLWSEALTCELLVSLRMLSPLCPEDVEGDEQNYDVLIAARLFYEVLRGHSEAKRWPVVSGDSPRPSLVKTALQESQDTSVVSLVRLEDRSVLIAANIARWLLRLPQQSSPTMVFAAPPRLSAPRARSDFKESDPVAVA
jgi:hypothetical protein